MIISRIALRCYYDHLHFLGAERFQMVYISTSEMCQREIGWMPGLPDKYQESASRVAFVFWLEKSNSVIYNKEHEIRTTTFALKNLTFTEEIYDKFKNRRTY